MFSSGEFFKTAQAWQSKKTGTLPQVARNPQQAIKLHPNRYTNTVCDTANAVGLV